MSRGSSPGESLQRAWERFGPLPGGKWIVSRMLWRTIPYTSSVRPLVLHLSPGHAKVQLKDRHALRNHLGSVHAIALMNLGEFSTGLAVLYGAPPGLRSIVTRLSMEYLKKARGTITAEARTEVPAAGVEKDYEVTSVLTNEEGEIVARAQSLWRVGAIKPGP